MDSSLLTEDELEKTKKTTPGVRAEKLTMEYLIKATYRRVLLGDQPLLVGDGGGQCKLAVVAPGGRSYHIIDASPAWQVSKLMKQIEKFDGTHVHEQRLFVDGRKLEVQKTLSDYVSADCEVTIHLFLQLQGGGACSIVMDSSLLDPRFDYDFTYLKSGKKVLYRGTPHTTGHMAKRSHWYAVVVCLASSVADGLLYTPCMYSLDPLGVERTGTAERVRQYLATEWQARHPDQPDRTFNRMPLHCPKIPFQTNTFDCGLYMLQCVESLLRAMSEGRPFPWSPEQWAIYEQISRKRQELETLILSQGARSTATTL